MEKSVIQRASQYWDKNVQVREEPPEFIIHWLNSPLVGEHCLNILKDGDKTTSVINWLQWAGEKYVPKSLNYGLSLGCGDGALERHAMSMGLCKEFDAFDVSTRSVDIAINESRKINISDKVHYSVADINNIKLEKDKYDIAFIGSAMHHFENLEHVTGEIKNSLKKDGLLIVNEFIGPSQFQWTDKQLRIMNDLLQMLPIRIRNDVRSNKLKDPITRPTLEHMNTYDPSEAIRSAEIVPVLEKSFQVVERVDFGGTLLHLLLQGIVDNFDTSNGDDIALLKMLGYIENVLIREGVLSSDFAIIVLKNKSKDLL